MIAVLLRKFSQLSLTCLSLGSVTWHHRLLLSVSTNWIHLWWGCLWLSGRFLLLLEGFCVTWGSRSCRNSAELFWWDFRRWLHYLLPLNAKRKNISCKLVEFYPLLWIFSPEKSQASAVIVWDSNLNNHCFYVGWKCYLVFSEAKNNSDQTLQRVWSR